MNVFQQKPLYGEQIPSRMLELVTRLVVEFQFSDDCLCSNYFLVHVYKNAIRKTALLEGTVSVAAWTFLLPKKPPRVPTALTFFSGHRMAQRT